MNRDESGNLDLRAARTQSKESLTRSDTLKSILGFLASGLFALFAALVIAALQIGGVISMAVVKILLVVAWLVGVGGIVLSGIMLAHPPRHKIVVSGGAAIILGAFCYGSTLGSPPTVRELFQRQSPPVRLRLPFPS